jgi:hypothetical protein
MTTWLTKYDAITRHLTLCREDSQPADDLDSLAETPSGNRNCVTSFLPTMLLCFLTPTSSESISDGYEVDRNARDAPRDAPHEAPHDSPLSSY